MISTRDLSSLPSIDGLRRLCQSLAMLDAILAPEWDLGYYSFDSHWADAQAMASMRDGNGDDYFLLFDKVGAILKGYAHEVPMAAYSVENGKPWPGVLEDVPKEFLGFLVEPAFSTGETTFCFWRTKRDHLWRIGDIQFPPGLDPDGSEDLLSLFDGNPQTYQSWAEEYFERPVSFSQIEQIYHHQPLSAEMLRKLNPDISLKQMKAEMQEIGYPTT